MKEVFRIYIEIRTSALLSQTGNQQGQEGLLPVEFDSYEDATTAGEAILNGGLEGLAAGMSVYSFWVQKRYIVGEQPTSPLLAP
jgi:hypothetical protein